MSVGGGDLKINYASETIEAGAAVQKKAVRKSAVKSEIVPVEKVTAYINPSKCVNCGTCREICPVGAIEEQQRIICHMCPNCTDKPTMSPQACEQLTMTTSCTTKCPLGISPQGYVGLTKIGKYQEAYKLIWDKNPLLSVCANVCHHPCEDGCKRGIVVDNPIDIRGIKKFLAETVEMPVEKYVPLYDETVAIIGAGPAGLTAGHYLAKAGYEVTIFESSSEAGGMLLKGIPEFRLNRDVVRRDIAKLEAAGLEIRVNQRITPKMVDALRDQYDIIVVAAGTPVSKELQIPGWRLAGVMTAMSFMRQVNHSMNPEHHLGQIFNFEGGEAVVIGGGSVAMDVARTAVRVGASKVTVVCLEEGDAVPAHAWEVEEALEEGIEIIEGYSPVMFTEDLYPHLTGVKFAKVKSMGKNDAGQFVVETDDADTIEVKCDWCVEAIGQQADLDWKGLEGDDIFFAGDLAANKCSVIDAMASGRDAAIAVDAALRGRAVKNPLENHTLHMADINERIFPYNRRKAFRPAAPMLGLEDRLTTFAQVEGVYSESDAILESKACLACGFEKVDPEKCLACGMCQKLCPKGDAIVFVAK